MPNRLTSKLKIIKQIIVMIQAMSRLNQKPKRDINQGNAKNMGKVGITYQKVYQA